MKIVKEVVGRSFFGLAKAQGLTVDQRRGYAKTKVVSGFFCSTKPFSQEYIC